MLEKINAEFPGLDERGLWAHGWRVQTMFFQRVMAVLLMIAGGAMGQEAEGIPIPRNASIPSGTAPPEVVASAVAAVDKLGRDVVKGDFKVAIERMNPQWMERLAAQTPGGREAIQKQIEGASKRLAQEGVSIVSSVPQGTPRSFEVSPGKRVEKVNDQEVEVLIFTKWLVLVPTLTKYRLMLKGDPKPVFIEKVGFQVAVSDKAKSDWTFIDGSNLTVSALRRLYSTLPKDLELPRIEERQAR